MASYINGLTDVIPIAQPFQPDFNLIQRTMGALQSKYDQGFNQLRNNQAAIYNADLTDPSNKLRRDQYSAMAQSQLSDVNKADLSIDDNVSKADSVFAPFWKDDLMMMDMGYTKSIKSEMSKAMSVRDSSDEKVRAQYNDLSVRYLSNGLEQLQNANGDKSVYSKLDKRRWVPFKNIEEHLNEQAKLSGLVIKWDSPQGPYMVTTEGGPSTVTNFQAWAHNMMGNNFSEQLRVMGTVEREETLKQRKAINPLLSDAEITRQMATEAYGTIKSGADKRLADVNEDLSVIDKDIAKYPDGPLTPKQQQELETLVAKRNGVDIWRKNAQAEVNELSKPEEVINKIATSPNEYYANVNKTRIVQGWGNARSMSQTTTIAANAVWNNNVTNQLAQERLKFDYYNANLDAQTSLAKGSGKTKDYNGDGVIDESDVKISATEAEKERNRDINSGHIVGLTTDAVNRVDPVSKFEKDQKTRYENANNMLYDMNAGTEIFGKLGYTTEDARDYMQFMKEMTVDPMGRKVALSPDKFPKLQEMSEKLALSVGGANDLSVGTIRKNLVAGWNKHMMENKDKATGHTKQDLEIQQNFIAAGKEMDAFVKAEEEANKANTTYADKNISRYGKILTTDDRGNKTFVNKKTLMNEFTDVLMSTDNPEGGPKIVTLVTKEMLADSYLNGTLDISSGGFDVSSNAGINQLNTTRGGLIINGKEYNAFNQDNADKIADMYRKRGTGVEFFKLKSESFNSVKGSIPSYNNKTGQVGFQTDFSLTNKQTGEVGERLIAEAALVSNSMGTIYMGDEKMDDSAQIKALRSLMAQGPEELDNYFSKVSYQNIGVNGNPTLVLRMKPFADNSKVSVDGQKLVDLVGDTEIKIELNPNALGETVRSIKSSSGNYVYGKLLEGETLQSDPLMNVTGFQYKIIPNSTKNPTFATIEINRQTYDNATGAYKDQPVIRKNVAFKDMNPDEIQNTMYSMYQSSFNENQAAEAAHKQQLKNQPVEQQVTKAMILGK